MTESVFLSPKSIAVIGASDKEGSVGRAITSNIMKGYKGTVFPISPSRDTVFDQKAYKSVLDVPEEIDLAVIINPNKAENYMMLGLINLFNKEYDITKSV